MEHRKFTYKVGVFVTVGVALLAVFILILGGNRGLFKSYYRLYVVLDEAQGLANGSAISAGGVQAGNIERIQFNPRGPGMLVTLKLERDVQRRVTKGSTITIRTQGALGDKFLYINPGPYGGDPILNGSFLETETNGDLLSTLSRSGGRFEKAFEAIEHLNHVLATINESHMVDKLSQTSGSLRNASASLDMILKSIAGPEGKDNKIKKSLDHLASIMEKIDKGNGTLGGLINDPTVHEDLKSLLGGAKRSKVLKYLIRQTIQKGDEKDGKE